MRRDTTTERESVSRARGGGRDRTVICRAATARARAERERDGDRVCMQREFGSKFSRSREWCECGERDTVRGRRIGVACASKYIVVCMTPPLGSPRLDRIWVRREALTLRPVDYTCEVAILEAWCLRSRFSSRLSWSLSCTIDNSLGIS